jgi:hypothetical protein
MPDRLEPWLQMASADGWHLPDIDSVERTGVRSIARVRSQRFLREVDFRRVEFYSRRRTIVAARPAAIDVRFAGRIQLVDATH